jgi:segregation and condensation protein B
MSDADVLPEVKQIVGSLFFTQRQPLTVKQILKVFPQTAEGYAGATAQYAAVGEDDVEAAVRQFAEELDRAHLGFHLVPVAGGWRLQNDRGCGPWVRTLLEKGKPSRLSRPALETLSIIAYRQPITRADIEVIRGVSADAIVRSLLEMGLIKVAGRSELPGRPWLFGTTQLFLESFGLNSLDDLPGMEELRRNARQVEARKAAEAAAQAPAAEPEADSPAAENPTRDEAEEDVRDENDPEAAREDADVAEDLDHDEADDAAGEDEAELAENEEDEDFDDEDEEDLDDEDEDEDEEDLDEDDEDDDLDEEEEEDDLDEDDEEEEDEDDEDTEDPGPGKG